MKQQIIALMIVLGFFMNSVGHASAIDSVDDISLNQRVEFMLEELENQTNSLVVQKLILKNILIAYSSSNIQDDKLNEKIEMQIMRISPALTSKEENFFNAQLMFVKNK